MHDDDQSPVIGTVSRPVTLNEALSIWRVKADDDPIKESAGRAFAGAAVGARSEGSILP